MADLDNNEPKWMTIGDAAQYLGISRDTLRRWEKRGKIKAVRSPTNRRYYTQKQLDVIMAGKTSLDENEVSIEPKTNGKSKGKSDKASIFLIGLVSLLAAAVLGFLIQLFFFR
jgi:excisionase family DNA binding protein